MDVGRRQNLRQPIDGLHVNEANVRHPARRTLELVSFGAPSVDDEHEIGFVREGLRGFENELYRLRQTHVPGVHHHHLVLESELASVGVLSFTGCYPARVDEVGDDSHLGMLGGLGAHVFAQIVREDGDGIRPFVAETLEAARGRDDRPVFQHAELDRDVWVDVLDVEDERCLAPPCDRPTGNAEGQRW
jgi:hypothetical protein